MVHRENQSAEQSIHIRSVKKHTHQVGKDVVTPLKGQPNFGEGREGGEAEKLW